MCFRLNVDPQATVRQLKLTLYNTDGINLPTYGQHLRYHGNTVGAAHSSVSFPPEEQLTLADYGITDGSRLDLVTACQCRFFDIFVEMVDGRIVDVVRLGVSSCDTAYSVKRLIREKRRIPLCRQQLSFEGTPLDDHVQIRKCTLTYCDPITFDIYVATSPLLPSP